MQIGALWRNREERGGIEEEQQITLDLRQRVLGTQVRAYIGRR